MSADPTLSAELARDGAWAFCAIKIELLARTLYMLEGAGIVTIDGHAYISEDPDFGAIAAIEPIEDSMDAQAPELRLVCFPPSATAAVDLANPEMQGAPVTVMVGAMDPATSLPIGQPEVLFLGQIDVATLHLAKGSRAVEFNVRSVFELLFETDEGERATDGFHQSIWPGELGLQYVTGVQEKLWWGANPPSGYTAPVPGGYGQINYRLDSNIYG
jgi:hypothetical protein